MSDPKPESDIEQVAKEHGPVPAPSPAPDRAEIWRMVRLIALGVTFIVGATIIVAYNAVVPAERVSLAAGQVAQGDILAPLSLTYESTVLTRLAQQAAVDAVGRVYDPPNPAVLRQQVQLARSVLDYINNIRSDPYSTPEQKNADLAAITTLKLNDDQYTALAALSDDEWKDVDAQVMQTLERAMRTDIREDNLQAAYANVPNLVSVTVSESEADVIVELVKNLIRPNTFFNEERTREAKSARALAMPPVTRSFIAGQIVVRAGAVVTDADMEALAQLKLLQPSDQRIRIFFGVALAVFLVSSLSFLYIRRFHFEVFEDAPRMVLSGGLFLLFLTGARLFDVDDSFLSHVYPAAAFTLTVVAITGPQVAMSMTAALAALIGVVGGGSLEFAMIVAAGGAAGVLTLKRVERLNGYFAAGLIIGVVNVAVSLLFGIMQNTPNPAQLLPTIPAGFLSGVLSAGLGLVGLYISSNILNLPTSVRLLELSQPSQPLLQRLLREAPGTYQHSLQVANLAELAAERVGANAALVRIAALYHDIGKLTAPPFFAENQPDGVNPHDKLTPEASARIIIAHVTEGEKMARKNRLPGAIIDFILQHHGTTKVIYFYNKAMEAVDCDESQVNVAAYTYPGPRPQTREAAIMMLADTSESIIRSKRTRNKQEIADTVREIIDSRLAGGQLDESNLTISDLRVIHDVFVSSLQGVFHPRIAYPAAPTPRVTQEMPAITSLANPTQNTSTSTTSEAHS